MSNLDSPSFDDSPRDGVAEAISNPGAWAKVVDELWPRIEGVRIAKWGFYGGAIGAVFGAFELSFGGPSSRVLFYSIWAGIALFGVLCGLRLGIGERSHRSSRRLREEAEEGMVFLAGTFGVEETIALVRNTQEAPAVMGWWREVARLIGESEARAAMKSAAKDRSLGAIGYILTRTKASEDEVVRGKRLRAALAYVTSRGWSDDNVESAVLVSLSPRAGA